jgi:hypothetical protein
MGRDVADVASVAPRKTVKFVFIDYLLTQGGSPMRTVSLLFALALLTVTRAASGDEFLISYWWGPTITQEAARLITAANFNVAQVGGKSVDEIRTQLDVCKANGLKAIVLPDGDRLMAKPYTDTDFVAGIDSVVRDYSSHPALWGYFLQDEPSSPEQVRQLAEVNRILTAKDPDHTAFINLLPIQAWQPYDTNVGSFCRRVNPKLLSFDKYALMQDGEAPDYYANLEAIRRQARRYNVPFNAILLVTPHGSYRDPSESDIRWQVYSSLAYGATGIMYFTYVTPPADSPDYAGWGQGLIRNDGSTTPKYGWVRNINAEIKHLAPILGDLQSNGVYHTDPVPEGCMPLPDGDIILDITGGQFVVGRFSSSTGETYLMFVNRNPRKAAYANIVFSLPVRLSRVDATTGHLHPVALRTNGDRRVWRTLFDAGEGRLVRVR